MRIENYKSVRVWVHIIVWSIFFSIMILPGIVNSPVESVVNYLIHFLTLITITYVNIAVLIPKYFHKEKYRQYILWLIVSWFAALVVIYISARVFMYDRYHYKFGMLVAGASIAFSMEFFLLALYKAAKEWYVKSQRAKEVELAKVQAELGFLRSQLDSHFIFNTLNNLYLLVLNRSDKAPDAILKLSDLLSYIIYESHEQHVDLSKELDFVENYISLQRLRLDETQNVHLEIKGDRQGRVAPLILFNFLENAFKHAEGYFLVDGVSCYIRIVIYATQSRLIMKVVNGKSEDKVNHNKRKGIGLNNAAKRLELLYKGAYDLDIKETDTEYAVSLTINRL
mgnify:CR=1 FL=1